MDLLDWRANDVNGEEENLLHQRWKKRRQQRLQPKTKTPSPSNKAKGKKTCAPLVG